MLFYVCVFVSLGIYLASDNVWTRKNPTVYHFLGKEPETYWCSKDLLKLAYK